MKLLWLLAGMFGLYVLYGIAAIAMHRSFIYPFFQEPFTLDGFEQSSINIEGADPLPVFSAQGVEGAPVVLYFMGNAGALQLFAPMLEHHRDAGRTVVAMTYRGGGGVPGAPSEAALKRDALAVFDAVYADLGGPVILHGYSLGTGLALHVAANRDADAVILSAPYASMCSLMAEASKLPACWLPVDRWDSGAYLGTIGRPGQISEPVLHLHGTEDELISVRHGVQLATRLKLDGATVEQALIEGAGHTDLMQYPEYLRAIDEFSAQVQAERQ